MKELISPIKLFPRREILSKPSPIPNISGLYGWYFKKLPPLVPSDGCVKFKDLTLLYIGISPDKINKPDSKQNLRKRITNHYRGNAEGSTLRKTLGILLSEESNFPLRRVGSGRRMTFTHNGEQWLDNWLESNAFVCWVENSNPREIEDKLFQTLSLPLNIQGNRHHPFSSDLNSLRKEAILRAKELPIADESHQVRSKSK